MSYKMLRNCLNCSVLALGLLLLQTATAQSSITGLDQQLTASQKQLPRDYVLQVWKKDDTLAYQKIAGELTAKSAIQIGASSSWMTAAMVMILVDEGKLSLDDKITKWLPEFEKYGKNYITIRHCLTHMTGIKGYGSAVGSLFKKKKFMNLEEEVNSYAAREIQTIPGTEFRFSEIGPAIAGRVLEVVTKKRFDQLVKQRLLTPLKMRSTGFSNATGGPVSPSDGATSTADDYMKFLIMLLNKGTYHGRRVLSEEAVAELLRVQVEPSMMKEVPKTAQGFSYTLGSWIPADNRGTVFIAPGFDGTWPIIDTCRGYAFLLIAKEQAKDEKGKTILDLKAATDAGFSGSCD